MLHVPNNVLQVTASGWTLLLRRMEELQGNIHLVIHATCVQQCIEGLHRYGLTATLHGKVARSNHLDIDSQCVQMAATTTSGWLLQLRRKGHNLVPEVSGPKGIILERTDVFEGAKKVLLMPHPADGKPRMP